MVRGRFGHVSRPKNIACDRLVRMGLHQRNVLVRRGMENDMRFIRPKHAIHLGPVADISNNRRDKHIRKPLCKLLLDLEDTVFTMSDHTQLFASQGAYLPAQFAADGSPGPCNQYSPSP